MTTWLGPALGVCHSFTSHLPLTEGTTAAFMNNTPGVFCLNLDDASLDARGDSRIHDICQLLHLRCKPPKGRLELRLSCSRAVAFPSTGGYPYAKHS